MRTIWQTLRGQHDLRLLLGAGLVSLTGDWILRVGLAYHIYVLTGSTLASSLMMLASFLPQVLLGSVAGVFVDRWDRRHTMVVANILLGIGLVPLLLVDTSSRVWVIYVVMLWEGCVQQFFTPAEQSLMPALVPDERLVTANALNGQTQDVARLLGSAVGGVAVAAGGLTLLTIVDGASFLVAAALISRVRTGGRPVEQARLDSASTESLRRRMRELCVEWAQGLRISTHQRVLRVILVFSLVTSIGQGIMGTLFAPFVHEALHGTGRTYGVIVSVQAVGGILGGLAAASLSDRVPASRLFGWGAVAFGAIDLVMFLYPLGYVAAWPAVVCMVLVGVPGALSLAGVMTLLQRHTTHSHRGRVFGVLGAVEGAAIVVGTLLAGFLGEAIGIIPVLAVQGGGYLLSGLAVVIALHHDVETPTSRATEKDRRPDVRTP